MKRLLVYLKNYKTESVFAPLFKLLEAVFELIVPLIVAKIIDKGIFFSDKNYVVKMCLVLVTFGVFGMVASITAQYFAAKSATGFGKELRHSLFDKISNLSFSQIDKFSASSLVTRLTNDVNQVQSGVNLVLRLFMRSPFIVIGAVVMAFTIDFKAALIFVAVVVLLSAVVFGIMAWTIPQYRNIQSNLDSVTNVTRESLTGVRVIRAFCAEEEQEKTFSSANNLLNKMQKTTGKISSLLNPATLVIINFGIIFLIYYSGVSVNSGNITQGQTVALYNYMSQILVELIKLANLIITVTKSFASADRIAAVLNENTDVEILNKKNVSNNIAVQFEDVSFSYTDEKEYSLKNVTFSAPKGSFVGIIGSTGSGKTTLVNLIDRMYDATQGSVKIFGEDVKSYTPDELKKIVGVVSQKSVLFKGTVEENLKWAKNDASKEEMTEALKSAQALEIVENKGGLNALSEQEGRNFSGGQKQRISIARTLVAKPSVLVLDDSSSALDFATEKKLRNAVRNLDFSPTVFVVSQRISSIIDCDKILVLDDGILVGCGTHTELLENCSVYKEIYSSQYKEGVK